MFIYFYLLLKKNMKLSYFILYISFDFCLQIIKVKHSFYLSKSIIKIYLKTFHKKFINLLKY